MTEKKPLFRPFKWSQIVEALKIVTKRKNGLKRELVEEFKQKRIVENENDAIRLLDMLELLGYLVSGISKRRSEGTWRASRRAFKEVTIL